MSKVQSVTQKFHIFAYNSEGQHLLGFRHDIIYCKDWKRNKDWRNIKIKKPLGAHSVRLLDANLNVLDTHYYRG